VTDDGQRPQAAGSAAQARPDPHADAGAKPSEPSAAAQAAQPAVVPGATAVIRATPVALPVTSVGPPTSAVLDPTASRNPLRDPADRRLPRVPEPCALVVFGVTGDLARKKLLPAIYDLANRGLLPADFVLLGFARRDWGDGDFAALAKKSARAHARTPWNEEVWKRLCDDIQFVPGSFDDDAAFDALTKTLDELRDSHGIKGNAAFYLSIPPSMFPEVL
jgi:glucose-6-phosphate 1-dehydrogenase